MKEKPLREGTFAQVYKRMNDAYKEAIAEEIIRNMICLHSRNVIHRDLSYR